MQQFKPNELPAYVSKPVILSRLFLPSPLTLATVVTWCCSYQLMTVHLGPGVLLFLPEVVNDQEDNMKITRSWGLKKKNKIKCFLLPSEQNQARKINKWCEHREKSDFNEVLCFLKVPCFLLISLITVTSLFFATAHFRNYLKRVMVYSNWFLFSVQPNFAVMRRS